MTDVSIPFGVGSIMSDYIFYISLLKVSRVKQAPNLSLYVATRLSLLCPVGQAKYIFITNSQNQIMKVV